MGKTLCSNDFYDNGKIVAYGIVGPELFSPKELGSFQADTWYKVKVILNKVTNTYDVWINDELKGQNLKTKDSQQINAFHLQSGHAGVKAYFDDVKIFEVAEAWSNKSKLVVQEFWLPLIF